MGASFNSVTGYRGVCASRSRFRAWFGGGSGNISCGTYGTKEEAAHAWNAEARRQGVDIALLNVPGCPHFAPSAPLPALQSSSAGSRVVVYWPDDSTWYTGIILSVTGDKRCVLLYEADCVKEEIDVVRPWLVRTRSSADLASRIGRTRRQCAWAPLSRR